MVNSGFKAEAKGSSIFLSLGFANAKEYKIPQGAKVTIQNQGLRILVDAIGRAEGRGNRWLTIGIWVVAALLAWIALR